MMDSGPTSWDSGSLPVRALPTVVPMQTTMLTKRRAVDHCRVRS
jgi:hypothetical protein